MTITVLMGELAGEVLVGPGLLPLVGAEVRLRPGASATLPLRPDFEHAVLTVSGDVVLVGTSGEAGGAGRARWPTSAAAATTST